MTHPKMKFTYVGVDSHKETHCAVFLDCFFTKLGEISLGNLPEDFAGFLNESQKFKLDGTTFLFGMEDVSNFGRSLAKFLLANKQEVKHVNAFLVAGERKNLGWEKSDSVDAECAARLLISKFGSLPDAYEDERYHALRTLVVRRDFLSRNNAALKTYLHSLLTIDFPNYHNFFCSLGIKSAIAFFEKYPLPYKLKGISAAELAVFLKENSGGVLGLKRAEEILASVGEIAIPSDLIGTTDATVTTNTTATTNITVTTDKTYTIPTHEIRSKTIQSAIRQLKYNMIELENVESDLAVVFAEFNTTLISMTGLELVSASQLLSCIGDIRRFATPAKLAKYAGIAPGSSSSGKRDVQFASQRGNRELNSLFYELAIRLTHVVEPGHRAINAFFYEYYNKKKSEGKTKTQALKCVQRRLVNIIWGMLYNNEIYVNPPLTEVESPQTGGDKVKNKTKSKAKI
jgi:transposase